jgi:hypothetical protein
MGLLVPLLAVLSSPLPQDTETWSAWLELPGGRVRFGLELAREDDLWHGILVNGPEILSLPGVDRDGTTLTIALPHPGSRLEARLADGRLAGSWESGETRLAFGAEAGDATTPTPEAAAPEHVAGRRNLAFEDGDASFLKLEQEAGAPTLSATVTGRNGTSSLFAGTVAGAALELSRFDGERALLLTGSVRADGTLGGDFHVSGGHRTTWTAARVPLRVHFVGNSYTERNDLPRLVAHLAAAAGVRTPLQTSADLVGGATLRQHWEGATRARVERSLPDVLVLQENSRIPDGRAVMREQVRGFVEAVRHGRTEVVLLMTWARRGRPEMLEELAAAYDGIAEELDLRVAPVGVAFARAVEAGLRPHDADGSHPNLVGSALAASVLLPVLTRRDPLDVPATALAGGLPAADGSPALPAVSEGVLARVLAIAHEVTAERGLLAPAGR